MDEPSLLITEMFSSIQGESTWAGLPCFFIRLTGCPLRCRWCDTAYAFRGGSRTAIPEILAAVETSGLSLAEVTGGEPLAQADCSLLCQALLDSGKTVLIETGGSLPIDTLPQGVIRIMDLKCPGSGEVERNLWSNLAYLNSHDEVKFVIASKADYEWARDVVREYGLEKQIHSVLFAPVFGEIESAELVRWILEDKLPVRFQLQMHKYIWEPTRKGV